MNEDKMQWIRLITPDVIPKYLVEQVRDKDYSVEDFYKYQKINCMHGEMINPFNHLYALCNEENEVKGFLWFVIDPLTKDILLNTYSVDKEYWYGGKAVEWLTHHMKNILNKLNLKKVYWANNYPKHALKHGFKRSKAVLMEYNIEENEDGKSTDGRHKGEREHQHVDAGTTASVQQYTSASRSSSSRCIEPVPAA